MTIRIWLADDHAVFRSGLRALIDAEPDLTVVGETGTGHDTIAAVRDESVDVLVLDLSMPGLRGPRVAEAVLEFQPDLAIVVLTMHDDEHYVRELFEIGARAFVLKKSTATALLQAIRAAHRGEQYVDPAVAPPLIASYVGKPPPKSAHRVDVLTAREKEVCRLLALGHTSREIGELLHISARTVETHRKHIMDKLELDSRAALVRFAIDNGLLTVE